MLLLSRLSQLLYYKIRFIDSELYNIVLFAIIVYWALVLSLPYSV